MEKGREVSDEAVGKMFHNFYTVCNKKGYLDNEEMCPAYAGTGCKDKKYGAPAGEPEYNSWYNPSQRR